MSESSSSGIGRKRSSDSSDNESPPSKKQKTEVNDFLQVFFEIERRIESCDPPNRSTIQLSDAEKSEIISYFDGAIKKFETTKISVNRNLEKLKSQFGKGSLAIKKNYLPPRNNINYTKTPLSELLVQFKNAYIRLNQYFTMVECRDASVHMFNRLKDADRICSTSIRKMNDAKTRIKGHGPSDLQPSPSGDGTRNDTGRNREDSSDQNASTSSTSGASTLKNASMTKSKERVAIFKLYKNTCSPKRRYST